MVTLPAPTALPLPVALPVSPLAQQATFGQNPYAPGNLFLAGKLQENTQQLLAQRQQKQAALFQQAQFAAQQNTLSNTLGMTLPSNPAGWTPQEAAAQTDNALAKLSTVNPELAAQLASQRTGQPPDGQSFLGGLMHAAGELLHPALSIGGKAMEYLGRTAHLVPNLAFDVVDGGGFSISHDIGGALTGQVNHNWNAVFQQAGWTGGGLEGFVRASLGLVGDFATDPLSYIPAGAGKKVAELGFSAARDIATKLPEVTDLVRAAPEMLGKTDAEILAKQTDIYDSIFRNVGKAGAAAGLHGTDVEERLAAALNEGMSSELQQAYSTMFSLGQTVGDRVMSRGFKAALAHPVFLPVGDGVTEISSQAIKDFAEKAIKDGNLTRQAVFAKGGDTAWDMGRAYSSLVGGPRFKYAIPFTQFRYISPAVNLGVMQKLLPARGLVMMTRFMAGQSGMSNMLDLIHSGAPDAIAGLQDWQRLGFRDFQKLHPEMARQVTGRFPGMSSAFYTGSDVVGGITAHFSNESKMARKGLASYQAYKDGLAANSATNNFVQDVAKRALGEDGAKDFLKRMELDGISAKTGKTTANESFLVLQMKFRDYFPLAGESAIDTTSPTEIDALMHARYPELGRLEQKAADGGFSLEDERALTEHQAILDDAQKTAAAMHSQGNVQNYIDLQKVHQAMLEEAAKHDLPLGNVMYNFDEAVTGIPTKQLDMWRGQAGLNHSLVYTKNEDGEAGVFFMHKVDQSGDSWNEALTRNPNDGHIVHGDSGSGFVVSTKRLHPDDIKVGIKGQDFYQLDANGNAQVLVNDEFTDIASVRKAIKDTSDAAERQFEQSRHGTATPDSGGAELVKATRAPDGGAVQAEKGAWDVPLDPEEKAARQSLALTEELRRYRPDAAGTYTTLEDGSIQATIWDPQNIIRLDDEQPWLQAHQGFAHRTLSERWGDWLSGNLRNQGEQALLAVPHMRARLARETLHMTAEEASKYVKSKMVEYIVDESHLEGDAATALRDKTLASMKDLPDFVWETNPLVEHAKYLNDMAQGIRATELGRAGQRMNRLAAFAPSAFPRPPKGPLFARTIDPGVMKALEGNDKDLVNAVLAMHKGGAKFFAQRTKYYSTIANNMGTFNMLVSKMEEEGYPIGREAQAWIRYGEREKAVRQLLDGAEGVINKRNGELEDEAARLDGIREAAATTISAGNQGLGAMELGDGLGQLPTETAAPATDAAAAEKFYADEYTKLRQENLHGPKASLWADVEQNIQDEGIEPGSPDYAKKVLEQYHGLNDEPLPVPPKAAESQWRRAQQVADDAQRSVEGGPARITTSSAERQAGTTVGKSVKPKVVWEDRNTGIRYPSQKKAVEAMAKSQERAQAAADKAYETFQAARDVPTAEPAVQYVYHTTTRAAVPGIQAEGLKLKRGTWLGTEGVDEAVWGATDASTLPPGEVVLRTVKEPGVWSGREGYDPSWVASHNPVPAAKVEALAEDGAWHPISDLGQGEVSLEQARQMFDDRVAAGQVYYNSKTGSVLLKDGSDFVKQGGGRRVRSLDEITAESEDLKAKLDDISHHRDVLAGGKSETALRMRLNAGPGMTNMEAAKALPPAEAGYGYHLTDATNLPGITREGLNGSVRYGTTEQVKGLAGQDAVYLADTPQHTLSLAETQGEEQVLLRTKVRGAANAVQREESTVAGNIPAKDLEQWTGERWAPLQKKGFDLKVNDANAPRRVATKTHAASEREVVTAVRKIDAAQAEMERAMNSVNKIVAEQKGLKARLTPALVPLKQAGGLEGLTPMRIPGMEGYAMPSYIAEEWHRIYDVAGPGHLSQEWRKYVLGPWKRWATYRNPGFHVRNFFGAWFNNWLGGVGVDHYGFSYHINNTKFADTAVDGRYFDRFSLGDVFGRNTKGELTYGQVNSFLAHHGIGEGNVLSVAGAADTYNLAEGVAADLQKVRGRVKTATHALDNHLRNVGSYVEDFHRTAAWARGMEATGGDPMGARAFVMMRHGDYSDLTKTEDYIKDIVPFYKWMRTNIPYQIRNLAENPAKLAAADKLKSFAYDVEGLDRTQSELQMPDWMKQTMSVPIPSWVPVFGSKGPDAIKYAMFDLPYNDLYTGLNDYMSSALPMVRNVMESWGLHKQTFTGKDLNGKMVPLSGVFNIPGVRDVLGAMPFGHKAADGTVYISDQVENVLTGFPIFSKFRNFLESDPTRVQQRYNGLLSSIAGIGVRGADFTDAELAFYNDEVAPALQALRDQGVVFPTTQQFASASQAVTSAVTPSALPLPLAVQSSGVLSQGA